MIVLAAVLSTICASQGTADSQDDWSGGPDPDSVVVDWAASFDSSMGVAWMAVPGQLALSSAGTPGEFVESPVDATFPSPSALAAGDLNGDGLLDLVAASIEHNQLVWWQNGGSSGWQRGTIDDHFPAPVSVAVGDLDGDRDLDVVAASYTGDRIGWWENLEGTGTYWMGHSVVSGFRSAFWVSVADLDQDGDLEVLGAAEASVSVWTRDTSIPGAWIEQVVDSNFAGARALVPGDVDGDGDVDLAGAAFSANAVAWWSNEGGNPTAWLRHDISSDFAGAHHLDLADLDHDGDLDVVGAGHSELQLKWWRNEGGSSPRWTEFSLEGTFPGGLVVEVADVDGDNRSDVIATSGVFGQVKLWRSQDISSNAWEQLAIGGVNGDAWPVLAADLDADGALDIVAGAGRSTGVTTWAMSSFVDEGWLVSSVLSLATPVNYLVARVEADSPLSTTVAVEVRISEDLTDLGPWQPIRPEWSLPIFLTGPAYLQYRLRLVTFDSVASPVVREVVVDATDIALRPGPRRPGSRFSP